jgi:hypothetical protein
MKAIKITKTTEGIYNYYEDDILVKSNLSVRKVVRKNGDIVGDIVLPANEYGKKTISTTRFTEGITEVNLSDIPVRTSTGTPKTKTPKVDLDEYYTEEEKAQIEKLQAKIDKINEAAMARAQKDLKMKELKDTLKAIDPDTLKAMMAELMGGEA